MSAKADTLVDGSGDREELDRILPFVYDELRRMAHRELRRERADHTLTTTDLVHEAYLSLVDQTRVERRDRVRFFAAAATAMRRILIQYARRRQAAKRGGASQRSPSMRPPSLSMKAPTRCWHSMRPSRDSRPWTRGSLASWSTGIS